jgi:hypothetical protein
MTHETAQQSDIGQCVNTVKHDIGPHLVWRDGGIPRITLARILISRVMTRATVKFYYMKLLS